MGKASSKLPPLGDRDLRTVMSYGLREEHLNKFLAKFREVDTHYTGVWGVAEMFSLIGEPRLSVRAPIIDALFFMGDSRGEGSLTFPDFLVLLASFCALSREEVLQLVFIVMDRERNGRVDKQELLDFFSYIPVGSGGERAPVFPVNNKNSLDKFRQGRWTSLEFDGLVSLCAHFPYISYPAYHTQELYRQALLGKAFWEKLDLERAKSKHAKPKWVTVPGSRGRQQMEVKMPGRATMQELLDYSRRTTDVNLGRRVESQNSGKTASRLTQEKDEQIQRCPILTMVRNARCMYYIPRDLSYTKFKQEKKTRAELELPEPMADGSSGRKKGPKGVVVNTPAEQDNHTDPALDKFAQIGNDEESESESESSGSYDSEDEEEDDEEEDDDGRDDQQGQLPPPPAPNLPLPPA